MHLGELVEYGTSEQVFDRPASSARGTTSAGPSGESWRWSGSPRWRSPHASQTRNEAPRSNRRPSATSTKSGAAGACRAACARDHARGAQDQGDEQRRCDSSGAAALLTLRNSSGVALRRVPIQINVRDARGTSVFKIDSAGLSATLVSAALVPAHGAISWIDDQIDATGGVPASVLATVGEGTPTSGAAPQVEVQGRHLDVKRVGRAGRRQGRNHST